MRGLARWCLTAAARRWPAELRDEMAREWHAELAAIEAEPGGRRRALAYALSLLTSPPFRDRSGVPRGWAETTGPLAPAAALVLAGLLTLGVHQFAGSWTSRWFFLPWSSAAAQGLPVAAWCLLAGWWLGRRAPLEPTARLGRARLGRATSAAFAPLLLAPALLAPALTDQDPLFLLCQLTGLLVWAPAVGALGVAAVRSRHRVPLIIAGIPLISAAAVAAATLPLLVSSQDGPGAAAAALLAGDPPTEFTVIPEDAATSRSFFYLGPWAVTLAAFAVLAVAFGLAALRPLPRRQAVPATEEPSVEESATIPAVVTAAGAACVALPVVGWAYTVTVLTPAMPGVSESAPMPGGDGEIYLWVAELRWGAVLLAALGMLVATADRRRAVPAALALAGGLLVANGALVRADADHLRLALLLGGVVVAAAWLVAGGPLTGERPTRAVRRRAAVAALLAAACAPMLLTQGTPGVNHPFLPAGLVLTTTGLAVLGVLLAAVLAVALAHRRPPRWAALLLIVLPAAAVAGAGLAPVPVESEDTGFAMNGALVGLPLAVVILGLLRRHRPRRRGRTLALWAGATLAAVPATVFFFLAAIFLVQVAPNLLFATEGLGYPADGLSVVPGAALLLTPLAAFLAARLDGSPGRRRPWPATSGEAVPG